MCSGQEVWTAWDSPIEFIALAIHPDVMLRAAYERSSKTIVLKAEPNLSDQVVVNLVHAIHSEIDQNAQRGRY